MKQSVKTSFEKLPRNAQKVLRFLARNYNEDMGYYGFVGIAKATRLSRREVKRQCRLLTRRGLAQFAKGLWSEEGEPRGAGYASTNDGQKMLLAYIEAVIQRQQPAACPPASQDQAPGSIAPQ